MWRFDIKIQVEIIRIVKQYKRLFIHFDINLSLNLNHATAHNIINFWYVINVRLLFWGFSSAHTATRRGRFKVRIARKSLVRVNLNNYEIFTKKITMTHERNLIAINEFKICSKLSKSFIFKRCRHHK